MRALVPFCALLVAAPGLAQNAPAPPPRAARMPELYRLLGEGQIMPMLAVIEEIAADPAMLNTAAQFWAFSGDVETADRWFADSTSGPFNAPPPVLIGRSVAPAVETIVQEAEGIRVVILNEAHHAPRHRAFSHEVMLALREVGFTHFAAETFRNGLDIPLLQDGAPVSGTGAYTHEPVFGDLVRQAAAIGYDLVAYEQRTDQQGQPGAYPELSVAFREQAQAENIKTILDADPDARIFVYVGFAHVAEGPMGNAQLAWFAARLKRMIGEDVLTIDQVEGTPMADPDKDSVLYRAFLVAHGDPEQPEVIVNSPQSPFGQYPVDLSVFHPRQETVNGRPDWLSMNGYRTPHDVRFDVMNGRTLIRAFVENEPEGAIPMDQILAPAGAGAVTLMLPPGEYRLMRQTEAGENIVLGTLTVT